MTLLRNALDQVRGEAVSGPAPAARPEPWANLSDDEVRRILRNARRVATGIYMRAPWWSFAVDIFAVGSTSGAALCRRAGIDPDKPVGSKDA